ncbi:MAG TPA: hypothetical protein VND65_18165 [Candidatus Binatia bacterium]|nr:hypothetical protein [Candidatus Binatia bacterium]
MGFTATPRFPGAVAGAADLLNHINFIPGETIPTLASPMLVGDTSATLTTGTGANLPASNFSVSVESEIMFVASRSGDTLSSITRSAEGTTASAHSAGVQVQALITAKAHNQVAAEVNAVETNIYDQIQVNGVNIGTGVIGLTTLINGLDPQSPARVSSSIIPVLPDQLYVNGRNIGRWPIDTLIDGNAPSGALVVNKNTVYALGPRMLARPLALKITSTALYNNVAYFGCINTLVPGQLVYILGCAATYNSSNSFPVKVIQCGPTWFAVSITNANIAPAAVSGGFAYVPALDIRGLLSEVTQTSPFTDIPVFTVSDGNGVCFLSISGSGGNVGTLNITAAPGSSPEIKFVTPSGGGPWSIQGGGMYLGGNSVSIITLASGDGATVAPAGNINLAAHRLRTGASGTQAAWDMAQFTGSALAAPGSGVGRLEWLAGTAGGLKLVAFAGSSTVGSTIADNVGNGRNQTEPAVAYVDLTAQTAAIAATTLYAVPAAGAGLYRLSWYAKVTTAAGSSSTLGALTITFTDQDGVAQSITCAAQSSAGTIETTDAGNTTTTLLSGLTITINANSSTNIQYAFAYASNPASAMNYTLHIRLEAL